MFKHLKIEPPALILEDGESYYKSLDEYTFELAKKYLNEAQSLNELSDKELEIQNIIETKLSSIELMDIESTPINVISNSLHSIDTDIEGLKAVQLSKKIAPIEDNSFELSNLESELSSLKERTLNNPVIGKELNPKFKDTDKYTRSLYNGVVGKIEKQSDGSYSIAIIVSNDIVLVYNSKCKPDDIKVKEKEIINQGDILVNKGGSKMKMFIYKKEVLL